MSDEVTLPDMIKYATANEGRVLDLIMSESYCMQRKMDGRRLIILKRDVGITCYNKRYEPAMAPKWLLDAVEQLPSGPWAFDGELVDDDYYIFDMPVTPRDDGNELAFDERQLMLQITLKGWRHPQIHKLDTWYTSDEKFWRLLDLRKHGAEGVVLRPRETNPYFTGQIYKYKFYQSVDAVVTDLRVEGKQAITVAVFHNGELLDIGKAKVDFETQAAMKSHSSVVEIRHRGLSRNIEDGGKMIEPVFLRVRDDKPSYSCSSAQLTVRGEALVPGSHTIASRVVEALIGSTRDEAIRLIKGERINDEAG